MEARGLYGPLREGKISSFELPVDAVAFGRMLVYYICMSIEGGGEGGIWITKRQKKVSLRVTS